MLTIKVLGTSCSNCKALETIVRKAVASMGIQAKVIKVEDTAQIMQYPILSTPALVINEKVVAAGRVPGVDQVFSWLTDAALQGM